MAMEGTRQSKKINWFGTVLTCFKLFAASKVISVRLPVDLIMVISSSEIIHPAHVPNRRGGSTEKTLTDESTVD